MILLSELIKRLTDIAGSMAIDPEVRLMTSPDWPYENDIRGVATSSEINSYASCEPEEQLGDCDVIFIVDGGCVGYGSKRAWDAAR